MVVGGLEQNDLVHGWGMDFKIGYCAQVSPLLITSDRKTDNCISQECIYVHYHRFGVWKDILRQCACWACQGSRSEKVGVIDAEYILHKGIPSLGGPHVKKVSRPVHLPMCISSKLEQNFPVDPTYCSGTSTCTGSMDRPQIAKYCVCVF